MFNNDEDDDKEGFYDGFEPEEPKQPRSPRLQPDDPRYWDREPDRWEHLRPSRFKRLVILSGAGILALILLWLTGVFFLSPAVDDAVQYGYIDHVERSGTVFKTYEGNMLPYKTLHDTTRSYSGDFIFSTSEKLGPTLRAFQNSGRPLRVEYRTYRYAIPWKGNCRTVVVRVDTVSPDSILPAAYRNN